MANVVIVGASGYSGAELAEILLGHPGATIAGVFGSAARAGEPEPFFATFPRFRGRLDMALEPATPDAIASKKPDAVFLCTPHEASLELTGPLRERGLLVIDLSAAFRLKDAALYPKHYGFEHGGKALLAEAVYGMPELGETRAALRTAGLIAAPGCYPTASVLALSPLVRAGAVVPRADGRPTRPIIDATSGVSGAGRKAERKYLFCEVSQQAYGVLSHRHQPEIDAYAGVGTVFTPHLGPYDRGILATIHVELAHGWTGARVRDIYERAYRAEPFVRVLPAGSWPAVADVRGTNCCDIAFAVDEANGHLVVVSAIDNLVKGAAGQAVQCMNIRLGMSEGAGLIGKAREGGR